MFREPNNYLSGDALEGKNKKKVRSYLEISKGIEKIKRNFNIEVISSISYKSENYPIFLITNKSKNNNSPNIFFSAGVHGREPAGVYTVLNFFENHASKYIDSINFLLYLV